MKKFEILCVTMNQTDFSKIRSMNIHSDVIFANQANKTDFNCVAFDNHIAKMISTQTRGVGVNRNIALMYASAEICLLGDDDVVYKDELEKIVVNEFESHPDADVFIFNFEHYDDRVLNKFSKTTKCSKLFRKMGAGFQIAFRLASAQKANLWFTSLFGGGCIFPCGEDSKWLTDAYNKNLNVYVSKEILGTVSFETSTWFQGVNERYFYGYGAFYKDTFPQIYPLWMIYFALRTTNMTKMSFLKKIYWMRCGVRGYKKMLSYEEFVNQYQNRQIAK